MKNIYLRVCVPIVLLLVIILAIILTILYQAKEQEESLRKKEILGVESLMLELKRFSEIALKENKLSTIERKISHLGMETDIQAIALVKPQGTVLYANRYAWKTKMGAKVIEKIKPEHVSTILKKKEAKFILKLTEDGQYIQGYFPVIFPTENKLSGGLLYIQYNLDQQLTAIWHHTVFDRGILWLAGLSLMLILMLILILCLIYQVNKPINDVVVMEANYPDIHITQTQLTEQGELAVLGDTFNELMQSLVATQQSLNKHMDFHSILNECNKSIVKFDSSKHLFDEICRVTQNKKWFSLAWIDLADTENEGGIYSKKIGLTTSYLENIFISINPNAGNYEQEISDEGRDDSDNFETIEDHNSIESIAAKAANIQSSLTFPISEFGSVVGTFNLYADSKGKVNDSVVGLLNEMAKDISFALKNSHLKEEKQPIAILKHEKRDPPSIILDTVNEGVIVTDNLGKVTRMNPVAEALTGWAVDDAKGRLFDEIFYMVDTETQEAIKNPIYNVLKEEKVMGLVNHRTLISKKGVPHKVTDSAAPMIDERNRTIGAILVFQDASEQQAMIDVLKEREVRFSDVIEASGSYVWEVDAEGFYTYLTEKVEVVKGYKLVDLLNHKPFEFMLEEDIESSKEIISSAFHHRGKFELTFRNVNKEGEVLWEEVKGQVIINAQDEVVGLRGVGMSINQRKLDEAKIEHLAYYDPLTSLPNRRMITERLVEEISSAKRREEYGALLFLDLDHFKNLNDSLGHEIGDELLVHVGKRLKKQLRQEDIAARLGGDEFIVLLPNLSNNLNLAVDKTRKVTEKLLEELRKPYQLKEYQYHNSSSIGIALFPVNNEDASMVFKQADTALYHSKDNGRNSFQFYQPEMQKAAHLRLEMEKDLRVALNEQQLELYYQPQVNEYGQLKGAEALVRWLHPTKGFIPPESFISIAEDAGLIVEIGDWIFRKCFYQVNVWVKSGLLKEGQHISINVSPRQFRERDFVNQLIEIKEETGVGAESIILELTEGTFLEDIDEMVEKMLHLRGLGFVFSIDDFGTGYSSLSYLKKLPINEIKIDKAFVDDLCGDSDDQIIVETIISMAKHLKFSVIAEGVETESQFEFLKERECFNYQGYFFSKPLSVEKFEEYMREGCLKIKNADKVLVGELL